MDATGSRSQPITVWLGQRPACQLVMAFSRCVWSLRQRIAQCSRMRSHGRSGRPEAVLAGAALPVWE